MIRCTPRSVTTILLGVCILLPEVARAKGTISSIHTAEYWQFDQSGDLNYDGWPDQWRRRRGKEYPAYLPIQIVPKDVSMMETAIRADQQTKGLRRLAKRMGLGDMLFSETLVDQYLKIQLNGGAAVVQSPPVKVSDVYSYRVSGSISTKGLRHDSAWMEYLFLNEQGEPITSKASPSFSGDTPWTRIELKPVGPPKDAVAMVVRLHLEPGKKSDIFGEAGFDNIRIDSLPQLHIQTDKPLGLYKNLEAPSVTCHVSGLARPVTDLRFRLHTAEGNLLAQHAAELGQGGSQVVKNTWQMPPLRAGFYRVYADLYDGDAKTHSTMASFAVLEDLPIGSGPFGWTFGTGHEPIDRRSLPDWLEKCRVGWVKYPCWLHVEDQQAADDLGWLFENLQDRGIQSIGMLDQPPEAIRDHGYTERQPLASILRDFETWRPKLEPLMTRFAMRTTWWQIGGESDYSFFGQPNVAATVDKIRRELQGFGQPIQVAIPWPWLEPCPKETHGGWKGICLSESKPYTASELDTYLTNRSEQTKHQSQAIETWITLDPLDASKYPLEDRIQDLISRMLTVQRHNVPIAFISNPFDSRFAFLNRDATPEEMLLPWRTTACLIGSLSHQGTMRFPKGSENVVMSNANRAVIVIWSSSPKEERIYLGENVKQVDVWGRVEDLPVGKDGRQIINVTSMPKFLINVEPAIALFRVHAKLDNARLESLPGRTQTLNLQVANPFGTSLTGSYTLSAPVTWETERQSRSINFEETGKTTIPVHVSLRSNATIGRELLRFDFALDLSRQTRFSIWRDIDVGPEDIVIDPTTRFDNDGRLIIRVNIMNMSDRQQQFNFYMLAQTRRHQRMQASVSPRQQSSHEFLWDNGKDLIGQTLTLQVEDRNSARIFIYPIRIEP